MGRLSTISTVQLLTGVHVDHFAEVNLLGFYDIVNDLGTIEVCLNHDVNDPIEGGGGTGLKLSAGHHLLDAATALQFVRQRHNLTNGDLDRTHRQQAFLSSVIHKLKTEGVIGDLGKMQSLLDTVKKDMVIDDQWDVLDFATKAQNLTGGNTEFHTLPLADVPNPFPILPGDGSVNLVDPARIKAIVTGAFNNDAPIPAATTATATAVPSPTTSLAQGTAEVYNATPAQVHGLAGAAQAKLSAAGWPVAKTGNLPGRSKTTITYGTGAQAAATQMAAKLGLTLTPVPSAQVKSGYVVITIGADYAAVGLTATTTNQPSVGATTATAPLVAIPTEGAQGGAVNASDGVPCVN